MQGDSKAQAMEDSSVHLEGLPCGWLPSLTKPVALCSILVCLASAFNSCFLFWVRCFVFCLLQRGHMVKQSALDYKKFSLCEVFWKLLFKSHFDFISQKLTNTSNSDSKAFSQILFLNLFCVRSTHNAFKRSKEMHTPLTIFLTPICSSDDHTFEVLDFT